MKKHIEKLQQEIRSLQAAIDAIGAKETLTEQDGTDIEAKLAEIEKKTAQLAILEKSEAAKAKQAKPAADPVDPDANDEEDAEPARAPARGGNGERALPERVRRSAETVGMLLVAMASVRRGNYDNVMSALSENGFQRMADTLQAHAKSHKRSLQAGSAVNGGILIPDSMQADIIELLRPATTFLRLNPRHVPMPNGTYKQGAGATGATAQYGVELQNAAVSEPTFRDVEMTAKELKALVPMSNMWLDFSLPTARAFVEADLRSAMAEAMDQNLLIGDGQQGRPLGIYNIPGIDSEADALGETPTLAQLDAFARSQINALALANVNLSSAKWTMGYGRAGYLEDIRDGNGNLAYPTMQGENKRWKGFPVIVGTNLPENLGAQGDAGYISFIASDHILFGEAPGMEFSVSSEAAYYDANNVLRTAFQRGETLLLAVMRHDVNTRHLPAISVRTGVRWG